MACNWFPIMYISGNNEIISMLTDQFITFYMVKKINLYSLLLSEGGAISIVFLLMIILLVNVLCDKTGYQLISDTIIHT